MSEFLQAVRVDDVSGLMARLRAGDRVAAGQLVALFYPELRRLAQRHMRREGAGHSWQPTVLIHELFLELTHIKALNHQGPANMDDRKAFLGLAAHLMKRLLIHHSRPLSQRVNRIPATEELLSPLCSNGADELALVESLLGGLEAVDPEFRQIVELRVFEGFSVEEAAEQLDIPVRTAYRRWTFARIWLTRHLN